MGLRIISGKLKGKKLFSPSGKNITRPTSDKVREAVFNILGHIVKEAIVLDLFAGTGALGIEAISRGAKHTVFVDSHKDSISIINKNIHTCQIESQTTVIKRNILSNLGYLTCFASFNLVFMDPPYNQNMIKQAIDYLIKYQVLAKDAILIVEHATIESIPSLVKLPMIDQRKYGKTSVSFLEAK